MYIPLKNPLPLFKHEVEALAPPGVVLNLQANSPDPNSFNGFTYKSPQHPIWTFYIGQEVDPAPPCAEPRCFLFAHTGRWERLVGVAGPPEQIKFVLATMFKKRKLSKEPRSRGRTFTYRDHGALAEAFEAAGRSPDGSSVDLRQAPAALCAELQLAFLEGRLEFDPYSVSVKAQAPVVGLTGPLFTYQIRAEP